MTNKELHCTHSFTHYQMQITKPNKNAVLSLLETWITLEINETQNHQWAKNSNMLKYSIP